MKILVSCSHSGGHFFPMLAFAQEWLKHHPQDEVVFWVSEKAQGLGKDPRIRFQYVPHVRSDWFRPATYVGLMRLFVKAYQTIKKERPDVMVGGGGLYSTPLALASCLKKVPIILHEQNVACGRATRFLIPFARRIAVSFPQTLAVLPRHESVVTGNLLREQLRLAQRQKILGSLFTVLVLGGSQGARFLNWLVIGAVNQMSKSERDQLHFIHLTGAADYPAIRQQWERLNVSCRVFPFSETMEECYSQADLVVARAGSSTLFEVAHFGLPSFLIPYPFADSHQLKNAEVFQQNGASLVWDQKTIQAEQLKEAILHLANDPHACEQMSQAVRKLDRPEAVAHFVQEVENVIKEKLCSSRVVCEKEVSIR